MTKVPLATAATLLALALPINADAQAPHVPFLGGTDISFHAEGVNAELQRPDGYELTATGYTRDLRLAPTASFYRFDAGLDYHWLSGRFSLTDNALEADFGRTLVYNLHQLEARFRLEEGRDEPSLEASLGFRAGRTVAKEQFSDQTVEYEKRDGRLVGSIAGDVPIRTRDDGTLHLYGQFNFTVGERTQLTAIGYQSQGESEVDIVVEEPSHTSGGAAIQLRNTSLEATNKTPVGTVQGEVGIQTDGAFREQGPNEPGKRFGIQARASQADSSVAGLGPTFGFQFPLREENDGFGDLVVDLGGNLFLGQQIQLGGQASISTGYTGVSLDVEFNYYSDGNETTGTEFRAGGKFWLNFGNRLPHQR